MRLALDLAEAWPQPHAYTPRFLRCEALPVMAYRLRRRLQAVRDSRGG